MLSTNATNTNDDDYEKRLQDIELQITNLGKDSSPEISEIKPIDAFQISTYQESYSGTHEAQLAIDGNEDTIVLTKHETNPWWCADMGGIYHVARVVITNRRDECEHCLQYSTNLRVGVTSTRPVVGKSLAFDAYTLCEEKAGYMGKVGIVHCPDEISGQYLVLQFRINQKLNVGEVKIYGHEDAF